MVDYADQARAPGALDALTEMGQRGVVSPLQAGTVRFNARYYAAALAQFEQVVAGSPDAAAAHLGHANTLVRLGREEEAIDELRRAADAYPSDAGPVLIRAGRLLESNGMSSDAEATYLRTTEIAPDRAPEASVRRPDALSQRRDQRRTRRWQMRSTAPSERLAAVRAQLWFWRAKVLQRRDGTASSAARDALGGGRTAPETYYGLRAAELLEDGPRIAAGERGGDTATLLG